MELPHRQPSSAGRSREIDGDRDGAPEANIGLADGTGVKEGSSPGAQADSLKFLHRIRTASSILALAVDDQCVFAGLQGGKIQVCLVRIRLYLTGLMRSH